MHTTTRRAFLAGAAALPAASVPVLALAPSTHGDAALLALAPEFECAIGSLDRAMRAVNVAVHTLDHLRPQPPADIVVSSETFKAFAGCWSTERDWQGRSMTGAGADGSFLPARKIVCPDMLQEYRERKARMGVDLDKFDRSKTGRLHLRAAPLARDYRAALDAHLASIDMNAPEVDETRARTKVRTIARRMTSIPATTGEGLKLHVRALGAFLVAGGTVGGPGMMDITDMLLRDVDRLTARHTAVQS